MRAPPDSWLDTISIGRSPSYFSFNNWLGSIMAVSWECQLKTDHLRKGFVPERLECGLRVLRSLPITKQVCPRLGFDGFDIDARYKISKERKVLLHIRPNFMGQ